MSFFKHVSVLNFASPFSVMKHNTSEIFQLKHILWTKRAHQSTTFQAFECSNESSTNSSCHFWNHKVTVYSNFVSLLSVMKDNSAVFFFLKPCILWTKRAHQKEIFRLLSGWVKITKLLMSYLKPQASFSLSLASLFSVMRDNSSLLF